MLQAADVLSAGGWCFKTYAYCSVGDGLLPGMLAAEAAASRHSQVLRAAIQSMLEPGPGRSIPKVKGQVAPASWRPAACVKDSCPAGLVTLRLSDNLFEGGTGCHEWEAGFFLAEFVLSHPELFSSAAADSNPEEGAKGAIPGPISAEVNHRLVDMASGHDVRVTKPPARASNEGPLCLELGSGCGVVGAALVAVGADRVVLTDGDLQTVDNCSANFRLNGICHTQVDSRNSDEPLTWCECDIGPGLSVSESPAYASADDMNGISLSGGSDISGLGDPAVQNCDGSGSLEGRCRRCPSRVCQLFRWEDRPVPVAPDVVLASDVLYDPENVPILVPLLQELLQRRQPPASKGRAAGSPGSQAEDETTAPPSAEAQMGDVSGPPPPPSSMAVVDGRHGASPPAESQLQQQLPVAYIATRLRNEQTLQLFVDTATRSGLLVEDVSAEGADSTVQFVGMAALEERSCVVLHRVTAPQQAD